MTALRMMTMSAMWISPAILMFGCGDETRMEPDGPDGGGDEATLVHVSLGIPDDPEAAHFMVAYQDGDSPWQLAAPPTGNTYVFPVRSGRFGVASTCSYTPEVGNVYVTYLTVKDNQAIALDAACGPNRTRDVALSGSLVNQSTTGRYDIFFGTEISAVQPAGGDYFQADLPAGTHDLIISRRVDSATADTLVVRDLQLSPPTTTIDLDASLALSPRIAPITLEGDPRGPVTTSSSLHTKNGTTAHLAFASTESLSSFFLSTTQAAPDDLYNQGVSSRTDTQGWSIHRIVNEATNQTFVVPPPLGPVSASVASSDSYPRIASRWAAYPATSGCYMVAEQPSTCSEGQPCSTFWYVAASSDWLAGTLELTTPDLSSLPGWLDAFELKRGTEVTGWTDCTAITAGSTKYNDPILQVGAERIGVSGTWRITP